MVMAIVLWLVIAMGAASAATINVTSVVDSGAGTLRQAVLNAAPGDLITFATNLTGQTILLTSGQIILTTNLTVDASAVSGGISISGNNSSRIFQVNSSVTVTLNSLTITNGNIASDGGGIYNFGTLTLSRCAVLGNTATLSGAGIFSADGSTLTLDACAITGNTAVSVNGGGVVTRGPNTHNIINTTIAGNTAAGQGGGLLNRGNLVLRHVTLAGNSAAQGGGLYPANGTVTLDGSIIAGNTASTGPDISGNINTNLAVNFIGDTNGASGFGTLNANYLTGDPRLAPLGNYGGRTLTRPPLAGSPVIDAAAGSTVTIDQRGYPRPSGAAPDIGAVEGNLVTTLADSGVGSLRQAIANALTGDLITFAASLSGQTITLTSEIVVANNVTLDASSLTAGLTVNGGNARRLFDVNAGVSFTLHRFTLTGGNGTGANLTDHGGAINSQGTLWLTRCTFHDNSASYGGAIHSYNQGRMTISDSTFYNNSSPGYGGAILDNGVDDATIKTLSRCTFFGNSAVTGGAIFNFNTMSMTHCTVSSNSATTGGGIFTSYTSSLTASNNIIAGNSVGDIVINHGALILGGANLVQTISTNSGTQSGAAPPHRQPAPRAARRLRRADEDDAAIAGQPGN